MTSRLTLRRVAALLGGLSILAHLWSLPWFLDDIDGINFALGVRHYDVFLHQPHPPGYPVYILLGKIGRVIAPILPGAALANSSGQAGPTLGGGDLEAGGLAIWGAIAGGLAAIPLALLFLRLEDDRRRALGAAALTLACPLFWFTSNRPLSDVPGLAAALASMALAAAAFAKQRGWHARQQDGGQLAVEATDIGASGRLIVLSALVAGLAVGLRSQTVWLTLPVLAIVIIDRAGRAAAGALLGSGLTFAIGVVLWFIPMVIATGGPNRYLRALTSQAGEDFEGVDMLVTSAQPGRRLALNLFQSFVSPWVSVPLAALVLALAGVGVIAMVRSRASRRGLMLLGALMVPYALFHLLFQENETVRYALPLVPPIAYLAVRGLDALVRRALPMAIGVVVLTGASLMVGVPALTAYAKSTSPVFQMLRDMGAAPVGGGQAPAAIGMHRRVFTESRRAREWAGPAFPWTLLPAPRDREWLELVKYWREGGEQPVWFVADPRRFDLALIDPVARRFARHYRWPLDAAPTDPLSLRLQRAFPAAFDDPALVGGARPDDMDWYVIPTPGWFLAEGWALTPETAGIADRERKGPGYNQAVGYVRRRPEAVQVMIGGRNLGGPADPLVRFTLAIDGRVVDTWEVKPTPGFFLRSVTLPAGALGLSATSAPTASASTASGAAASASATPGAATGNGQGSAAKWGELTVRAENAVGGGQPARASVEQFDLQNVDGGVMAGFDTGFHEAELDPARGYTWRWAGDSATLRIWPGGQDVDVKLRIESPGRYFDTAPHVTLRAGTQVIAEASEMNDFTLSARVPSSVLQASGGILTLTTDRVFVPAERRSGVTDKRRLGLRVLDLSVIPASTSR